MLYAGSNRTGGDTFVLSSAGRRRAALPSRTGELQSKQPLQAVQLLRPEGPRVEQPAPEVGYKNDDGDEYTGEKWDAIVREIGKETATLRPGGITTNGPIAGSSVMIQGLKERFRETSGAISDRDHDATVKLVSGVSLDFELAKHEIRRETRTVRQSPRPSLKPARCRRRCRTAPRANDR